MFFAGSETFDAPAPLEEYSRVTRPGARGLLPFAMCVQTWRGGIACDAAQDMALREQRRIEMHDHRRDCGCRQCLLPSGPVPIPSGGRAARSQQSRDREGAEPVDWHVSPASGHETRARLRRARQRVCVHAFQPEHLCLALYNNLHSAASDIRLRVSPSSGAVRSGNRARFRGVLQRVAGA